jgi:hypothetical protein
MTRQVRSWAIAALAASTLVVSTYSEAAAIRYDITNATSAQNGYSLSGYLEVAGTGNVTSFSSYNFTDTKADNRTLTFVGSGVSFIEGVMIATDSALYLPSGSVLRIDQNDESIFFYNDYTGFSLYSATFDFGAETAWESRSYPDTDVNGWRIGSVQGAPSSVPEIDPAAGGSVLSLVAGVLAMIEQRRRRATLVA